MQLDGFIDLESLGPYLQTLFYIFFLKILWLLLTITTFMTDIQIHRQTDMATL